MDVLLAFLFTVSMVLLAFLIHVAQLLSKVRKELQKERNQNRHLQLVKERLDSAIGWSIDCVPELREYSGLREDSPNVIVYAITELYMRTNDMLKEALAKERREQAIREHMLKVGIPGSTPYVDRLERLLQEITDDNISMKVTFDYRLGALRAVRKIREWLYILKTTSKTDIEQRL